MAVRVPRRAEGGPSKYLLKRRGTGTGGNPRSQGGGQQPRCGRGYSRRWSEFGLPDRGESQEVAAMPVDHEVIRRVAQGDHTSLILRLDADLDHAAPGLSPIVPRLNVPHV